MRFAAAIILFISIAGNTIGKDKEPNPGVNHLLDCPSQGMDLKGASNWMTYYHNIPIWQICGNLCQDYAECKGWTWNEEEPIKGECNLWSYVDEATQDGRKISGLKDCPF